MKHKRVTQSDWFLISVAIAGMFLFAAAIGQIVVACLEMYYG